LITLYLSALFPAYTNPRIMRALVALAGAMALTLLLPRWLYTHVQPLFQLSILFGVGYSIVVLIRTAIGTGDSNPVLVLLGFVALGVAVTYDILRVNLVVQSPITTTHYGLSAFVIFQSAVLAAMHRRRARELEQRNREVQLLNEELRDQIASRSHELSQALALIASPRPLELLQPGMVLVDKYRIEHLLGQGAMGRVYRAVRLSDGQPVAVKLMQAGDPQMLARFAREAELVARIDHPNVVGIHDFGVTAEAALFLVMELVEGGRTLEDQRDQFGKLTWAMPLVHQLAFALQAIHARGVIHRDVKPANILIANTGKLKLTDFGVAHVSRGVEIDRSAGRSSQVTTHGGTKVDGEGGSSTERTMDVALTRAGMLIGSPLYMAPEVGMGAEFATARSDLFSFGLVAYELLSGQRAYPNPVVMARIEGRPLPDPPPKLGTIASGLPANVAAAIDACLGISPGARPDAASLVRLFDEVGLG
jgi:serine/threonine-protein kinase